MKRIKGIFSTLSYSVAFAAVFLIVGILWFFCGRMPDVSAEVGDYNSKLFKLEAVANKDHSIDIKEKQTVEYGSDGGHGIIRSIPMAMDGTYIIENIQVTDRAFEVNEEDGQKEIKIGDADEILEGEQTFEYSYTLVYRKDRDPKADFLALNLYPAENPYCEKVELSLKMPKDLDWSGLEVVGGGEGSEDQTGWKELFSEKIDEKKNRVTFTGKNIPEEYGLALYQKKLPDAYWKGAPEYVYPSDEDAVIKSYDILMEASEEHVVSVHETILIDYKEDYVKYRRPIPKGKKEFHVENVESETNELTVEDDDYEMTVTILPKKDSFLGEQTFDLSYDLVYYKDTEKTFDELKLPLFPENVHFPVEKVSGKVKLPSRVDWSNIGFELTSSDYHVSESYETVFDVKPDTNTITYSGDGVPKSIGLTTKGFLPEGFWAVKKTYDEIHRKDYVKRFLFYLIPGILSVLLWLIFGRGRKPVPAEMTDAPRGLPPAALLYALGSSVRAADLMHDMLYLADKGYIRIEKSASDYDGRTNFSYVKEKELDESLWPYDRELYKKVFNYGNPVLASQLQAQFRVSLGDVVKQLKEDYEQRFGPRVQKSAVVTRVIILTLIGIISLRYIFPVAFTVFGGILLVVGADLIKKKEKAVCWIFGGLLYLIGALIAGAFVGSSTMSLFGWLTLLIFIVMILCAMNSNRLGEETQQIVSEAEGFERYIKTAKMDILKQYANRDPHYFYHILPYAVIFGFESVWGAKFVNDLTPQRPIWFHGEMDDNESFEDWSRSLVRETVTDVLPEPETSSGWYSDGDSDGGDSSGGGGGGGTSGW